MKNYLIYWAYFFYYYFTITKNKMFAKTKLEAQTYNTMKFALMQHHKAGQRYNKKYPYYYHLKMVTKFTLKFKYLLSVEDSYKVFLGALFHDFLEDLTYTYNDIKQLCGVEVADIVYACTELKGKNRKERHGPAYIKGLQKSRLGTYVKLCDICANMTMGKMTGSHMLDMYRKDYPQTKEKLYREEFDKIFKYIEENLL